MTKMHASDSAASLVLFSSKLLHTEPEICLHFKPKFETKTTVVV